MAMTIWGIRVRSKSWPELIEFYEKFRRLPRWQHLDAMATLVAKISTSPYAGGVFATTSHECLLVGQVPDFEMSKEVLSIAPLLPTGDMIFEYREQPFVRNHWRKQVAAADAYDAFKHFLRLQRWFTDYPE